jgi:hypothetical protein
MRISVVSLAALAGCILAAGVAQAAPNVNGLKVNPRVFNDHPTSTLTITDSNSVNNGTATINDVFTEGNGGANRHDVLLSSDSGATAANFQISDSFTFKTLIDLTDGTNGPRKEAGIRLNSPTTGDVLFIINSDAGEIVSFGGGAAFNLFGNNGGGNGYTPGSTILMGVTYRGNVGAGPATLEYFIDRDPLNPGGEATSGPLAYSNLELGSVNFNVAVYAQGQSSGAGDFVNVAYTNIMYAAIPEPSTVILSMLGMIGLVSLIRKRVQ